MIKSFFRHTKSLFFVLMKRNGIKQKKLKRIFLIIFLSSACVFLLVNMESFSPMNIESCIKEVTSKNLNSFNFPYKIVGRNLYCENFKDLDKGVALVSDTCFECFNSKGRRLNRVQHGFQLPILKSSQSRALVYDLGGKNFEINSRSSNIYKGVADNSIITANVCDNGTYGIVTEYKGFLSQMNIYAKNNREIFKYDFANHYITDIAFSKNGKLVAAVGATSNEGTLSSSLYVFNYKESKPKLKFDYDDNMFISVSYLSNGNIIAVGNKLVSVINVYKGTKSDYNYEGKSLTAFDINESDGIVFSLSISEDGSDSELYFINKKGKLEKNIKTRNNIKSISIKCGKIACLSYGEVYMYNFSLDLLGQFNVGMDARKIILDYGKSIYILGLNEVRKYRI